MSDDIDRKYRQRGYMESYRPDKSEKKPAKEKPGKPAGPKWQQGERPRTPVMPGMRTVSRCAACGVVLPALSEPLGQCPKCGAELHSCKQCQHFDPAIRYECTEPIEKRIADKAARNECEFFTLKVTTERDTSGVGSRPDDARKAFENLFKK